MIEQEISQEALIQKVKVELAKRELSRREFKYFVTYIKDDYQMEWFHDLICRKLQDFADGKIKKLMINLPPQHGKTELATRLFPTYLVGKNPNKKIAITSYSSGITDKLNRDVQRYLDDPKYKNVFENTRLSDGSRADSNFQRNLEVLDIIDESNRRSNGFIKTVGIGGSLTGTPVDIGIVDDPIKDFEEAQSVQIRQKVWEWYETVFETRLHNHSQVLMIMTRWHEDDPAGRVLEREGHDWEIIRLPAIREKDINEYDNRNEGEVLWENRHSLERMLAKQRTSPIMFNALYQQNPQPSKDILVFGDWNEIDRFPDLPIFYGLDFGFENDPTALIRMAVEVKDGVKYCYVHELIYQTKLRSDELAKRMKMIGIKNEIIYADKNASEPIAILRRNGFKVIGTKKGQGSVAQGISKAKEFKVYFTATSNNIRKERNNYAFIVIGNKPTNEPIDTFNHAMDAIRGALFTKYHKKTNNSRGIRIKNR